MDKNLGKVQLAKQRTNQVFPSRKTDQEYMMYWEIFVKPKEEELQWVMLSDDSNFISPELQAKINLEKQKVAEKVKSKMTEEQKDMLEKSNMMNVSGHELKKARITNFMKN